MATVEMKKKKRKVLRGSATKISNELKERTAEMDADQTHAKVASLNKTFHQLEELNAEIFDLMIETETEECCLKEVDRSRLVTEELEKVLKKFSIADYAESHVSNASTGHTDSKALSKYKLPKIELERYDLTPNNYVAFWSQFEPIDTDTSLTKTEKFVYLRMTLSGVSKTLIDTYPVTEANYEKALQHLKDRFGRKELVINAAYKELFAIIRGNPSIVALYDTVAAKIRCLDAFGLSTDQTAILVPLIVDCLPTESRRLWERRTGTEGEDKMKALMDFLGNEAEAEERVSDNKTSTTSRVTTRQTAAALVSTTNAVRSEASYRCIFCEKEHLNKDCTKPMTPEQRREIVNKSRCCYICLAPGHRAKLCKAQITCGKCGKRHREMCCIGQTRSRASTTSTRDSNGERHDEHKSTNDTATSKPSGAAGSSLFAGQTPNETVVLQTLLARVGKQTVRVILDTASHRSYITSRMRQNLKVEKKREEVFQHMLFGGQLSESVAHDVYPITLTSIDGKGTFSFDALEQKEICGDLPSHDLTTVMDKLTKKGIQLTDDGRGGPVDVLLGADVMGLLVIGVESVENLLAFKTQIGWCILGSFNNATSHSMVNVAISLLNAPSLPTLWDLETLGIEKTPDKTAAVECIAHFNENVKVSEEGTYHVCLPWIEGHPPLPENKDIAEARLKQVVARLNRTNTYTAYDETFKEWEKEGIIEELNEETTTSYYLPHRPVIREGKTTKIRPVFDASAKEPGGVSLNECLHAGPNLMANLLQILLRFRLNAVGLKADIRKAFLMIGLARDSDKNMLKFLWWRDGNLITFRHCRVVFGLTASPFLLHATINHLLEKFSSFSDITDQLRKSFYVDDALASVVSGEEADHFQKEATELLARGGFDLRDWIRSGDPEEQQVLGLRWLPQEDVLGIRKPTFKIAASYTKKEILSLVGRIYDPLGIIAATVLPLKLLLQSCFRQKLSWDEPVPKSVQLPVEQWLIDIDLVDAILIPRCLQNSNLPSTNALRLHVFCDASMVGLGTCVFARWQEDDKVITNLVASKARVSPDEKMTIPRLELVAAALAARLAHTVKEALNIPKENVTYWSDSTCTLYWIKRGHWKTFVGNRVKEILKLTDKDQWRFVDGAINPADVVSRGCTLRYYATERFWEGPSWLREHPDTWPVTELVPTSCEEAKPSLTLLNIDEEEMDRELFRLESFNRNVRVIAWTLRWTARETHSWRNPKY